MTEVKQNEQALACSECANKLKLNSIGITGSWGQVECDFCHERKAALVVVRPDGEIEKR